MIRKLIVALFILIALTPACDEKIPFPRVYVDFTIDINNPEYRDLLAAGNVINVLGGSRGIIIKRTGYDSFTAFDQHCPHDPEMAEARVSLEAGSIDFAICPTCKTKYNLYFGNVEEGPGSYSLLEYNATFYPNSNRLRVYN